MDELLYLEKKLGIKSGAKHDKLMKDLEEDGLGDIHSFLDTLSVLITLLTLLTLN
jgi:hypothetical protein